MIEEKQKKLETRINDFHLRAEEFLGQYENENLDLLPKYTGYESGDITDSDNENVYAGWREEEDSNADEFEEESETVENILISMPSSWEKEVIERLGLQTLAEQELSLRQGQANDCLQALRMALEHKAVLYRIKIRQSKSTKSKKRAWEDVKGAEIKVYKHVRGYRRPRKAMVRLGADSIILDQYQVLEQEDLKLSGDVTDENRHSQRNDRLPWFWALDGQASSMSNTWMHECELII